MATVEPHQSLDGLDNADVVIVCNKYTPVTTPSASKYPREFGWLQQMHAGGVLICSVCSGSLVLAEAGLLGRREVATHWANGDLFRRCYPEVRMRADEVLCLSSVGDRIVTAGAVAAWQDLVLWLIARFCGPLQALETAKLFLLATHDDGQLPYAAMQQPAAGSDAVISECQNWIAENYSLDNPVQRMAERSGLNPRTFARRFRQATRYQPIDYVQTLRIKKAKHMLEVSDLGLDEIAASVGYEDPASFRQLFRRKSGLTPTAYRRKLQRISKLARAPH